MWNQMTPQQQQFLMAILMGQPGMMWGGQQQGSGNPLMADGQSPPAWSQMPQWLQQGQMPPWLQGFLNQPAQGAPAAPPANSGIADGQSVPSGSVGPAPGAIMAMPSGPPSQSNPGALYGQMMAQSPPMPGQPGGPAMPQWLQQQAAQNYAQQAALAQTQQTGYLPAQQWGQQQMAPQDLTNGLGQQRLPDYSGGGPSISPYAMPGTVQWGG